MYILIYIFKKWLPGAIVTSGLCGLVYLSIQQSLPANANDPQAQIAEDTATVISGGADPESFFQYQKVDIAKSLAPFFNDL